MGNSLHPSSGRAGISARRPVSYGTDCKWRRRRSKLHSSTDSWAQGAAAHWHETGCREKAPKPESANEDSCVLKEVLT
jgi:hypothetical protein